MRRLYEPAAYGPQGACYWAETLPAADWGRPEGDAGTEVAVIGGGFTGLSAALHLAEAGTAVTVLEAEHPGYGASGRNGGFCCLGGAKASPAVIERRFGSGAARAWAGTEKAAVARARALIDRFGIDADTHSDGEVLLAHKPRAFAALRAEMPDLARAYGVTPLLIPPGALADHGLGGTWHGALHLPLGFALNPRKYHAGLAVAARAAGARLHSDSPVTALTPQAGRWHLTTPTGRITARRVILATNGYSSEDLPDWLAGRYLPAQSSVIVTRPLTDGERAAQGWTSDRMAYDSRVLLHYFRMLPEGRFLFGMRGGLRATRRERASLSRRIRQHFHRLFPAWRDVEITHEWDGLVCLMRSLTPFVGAVPEAPGLFAAMGFHGNGVAMGTHAGASVAAMVRGEPPADCPAFLSQPPGRFPLGRFRRSLLRPAYVAAEALDL
ncbi:NAD(P)/FAD-dependent oxidoreductase [Ponticoccus sp. (in: a-proteobacteria)]|uniref:NAD(P)/FAD-dependent oxidoreductase n=1 Tax=Ponticoccus sp. (in: a-proteobacteria) TaxID=1925025 RepID=UPI003AB6FA33